MASAQSAAIHFKAVFPSFAYSAAEQEGGCSWSEGKAIGKAI